jgi:hypothetical protein
MKLFLKDKQIAGIESYSIAGHNEYREEPLIYEGGIIRVGQEIDGMKFYLDDGSFLTGTGIYRGLSDDGLPHFDMECKAVLK